MTSAQIITPRISVFLRSGPDSALSNISLNSILRQSYKNWDAVVVDESGTPGRIAKKIVDNGDPRLRYYDATGIKTPLTSAARLVNGSIFAFLNNGDIFTLTYLEDIANLYAANPALQAATIWADKLKKGVNGQVPLYIGSDNDKSPLSLSQISFRKNYIRDLENCSHCINEHLSGLSVVCVPKVLVICEKDTIPCQSASLVLT